MMLQHMTLRHMALWRCGRSPMAKCSRNAFPGIRQWQYARAMRSRAAIRGNFCALCIPKGAWDGKRASRIMHGTRILPSDVDERREPPATTMPPPPGARASGGRAPHARISGSLRSAPPPTAPNRPSDRAPRQHTTHSIRGASGSRAANVPTPTAPHSAGASGGREMPQPPERPQPRHHPSPAAPKRNSRRTAPPPMPTPLVLPQVPPRTIRERRSPEHPSLKT